MRRVRGRLLGILCLILAVLLTTTPQSRVEAAIRDLDAVLDLWTIRLGRER